MRSETSMSLPTEPTEKLLPDEQQNTLQNEISPVSPSQEQPAQKAGAGGLLAPLRVRNFRLLFGGQLTSTIGDAFYAVALLWLVVTNAGVVHELGISVM